MRIVVKFSLVDPDTKNPVSCFVAYGFERDYSAIVLDYFKSLGIDIDDPVAASNASAPHNIARAIMCRESVGYRSLGYDIVPESQLPPERPYCVRDDYEIWCG